MSVVIDTSQELDVATLLSALRAARKGDFSVRLPDNGTGMGGKVAHTLNEVRRIQERAALGPVTGAWAASVSSVNSLGASLVQPASEAARVIGAVAKGDLSQRIALDIDGRPLEGEFLRTARTVNRVVKRHILFEAFQQADGSTTRKFGGKNALTFARTMLEAARQQGYKGVITSFGAAALTLTGRCAPAAIALDISLPDISGGRILERLKNGPATRHIPVYIVTTEEDRTRGPRAGALGFATKPLAVIEAGAWDYLSKPVDPEELLVMFRAWLVR